MPNHSIRPEGLRRAEFSVCAEASWCRLTYTAAVFLLLLVLPRLPAVVEGSCSAQTFGAMKGFKVAEPYGPPNEKQTKSQLEAGKAVMVRGGALLSEGVTLRTFSESNTLQLVVRAQECFYDSSNHMVNSAGPLQMQTADGKFSIEGVGFFWEQTNSSLFISNKVHTVIMAELFQGPGAAPHDSAANPETGPLTILSDQFSYIGTNGLGVWRQNVRMTGTNLALTNDLLTAEVPMKERQVHWLRGEGNVILDYHGLHGTGERLNYAPDTGLIRLWDKAAWTADKRQGNGDELIIDRSNQVFQVNGHARLNLPGQSIGETGFLSFSNTPAQNVSAAAQRSIDIECVRYEIRTNSAIFYDQVRLEERWNDTVRSRMSCQLMTASFAGTNELQDIVANKHVVIEQGEDKRFTGGHAVYTHTNTTLEITQKPEWQAGTRSGKGELLRLNTQLNEMLVRGNASLRLPANELASQLSPTNQAATARPAKGATNEIANVYCQEYTLRQNQSDFRGGVYATHPEMNWWCEQMTVLTPPAGITNVLSQGNVVFDLLTKEGKMHGTGDTSVYSFGAVTTATNGVQTINQVKFTGTPALLTNLTKGIGFEDTTLIWDRARNKVLGAGGNYKMQGTGPAIDTNTFQLPKEKRTK